MELEATRQVLSRALTDAEPEVARAAAFALARLGDPQAIPALLNYLERSDRRADLLSYEACQRALRALSGTAEAWTPRQWRDWWRLHRPAPASRGKR